jgi:hypothetical protein
MDFGILSRRHERLWLVLVMLRMAKADHAERDEYDLSCRGNRGSAAGAVDGSGLHSSTGGPTAEPKTWFTGRSPRRMRFAAAPGGGC